MGPDSVVNLPKLLARYKTLAQAELAEPGNAERQNEMKAIAGMLRTHHEAALAELEQQLRHVDAMRSTSKPAEGAAVNVGRGDAPKPAEPTPAEAARFIDPHLADKLRKQLIAAVSPAPHR